MGYSGVATKIRLYFGLTTCDTGITDLQRVLPPEYSQCTADGILMHDLIVYMKDKWYKIV